jgi:hypothetical protein
VKKGVDPLQFCDFKRLAASFLKSSKTEDVFSHAFLLLSWNLMCRASNCVGVCLEHIEWQNDALSIWFSHSKCDQSGKRERDPRHVYANPITPEICPILSLGIYLLSFPATKQRNLLFPGGSQYDRFSNRLSIHASKLGLEEIMDVGTHSIRKGSATYVSSGSTSCPPSAAVNLRAGWAMRGVQDTYVRYEGAGDMFVGRTAAGLPPGDVEFAILPPFFNEDDLLVHDTVVECFPNLPTSMRRTCTFVLASVVHHADFLCKTLPQDHPIFNTSLFLQQNRLATLKERVSMRLAKANDPLQPTGIPPYVSVMLQLHKFGLDIKKLEDVMVEKNESTFIRIRDFLEEKAVGLGSITADRLEDTLLQVLRKSGMVQPTQVAVESSPPVQAPKEYAVYSWGGQLGRRMPEDFQFGKMTLLVAFLRWCCGDSIHYPWRALKCRDFNRANGRLFCELRFLMQIIENEAIRINCWVDNPSVTQATDIFYRCMHCLKIPNETSLGRERRIDQLQWKSCARILRSLRKNHA